MRNLLVIGFVFCASSAFAQQQPDQNVGRIIHALQQQRNAAMDSAADQTARADVLGNELAKAQARIRELEPKQEEKKPDAGPPVKSE